MPPVQHSPKHAKDPKAKGDAKKIPPASKKGVPAAKGQPIGKEELAKGRFRPHPRVSQGKADPSGNTEPNVQGPYRMGEQFFSADGQEVDRETWELLASSYMVRPDEQPLPPDHDGQRDDSERFGGDAQDPDPFGFEGVGQALISAMRSMRT